MHGALGLHPQHHISLHQSSIQKVETGRIRSSRLPWAEGGRKGREETETQTLSQQQQQNSSPRGPSPVIPVLCRLRQEDVSSRPPVCIAERSPKKNKQQPVAGRLCGSCHRSSCRGGRRSRWRGDVAGPLPGNFPGLAPQPPHPPPLPPPPGVLLYLGNAFKSSSLTMCRHWALWNLLFSNSVN